MSSRIKLVQGDLLPDIVVAMVDRTTWAPVDVSASDTVVRLKFRHSRGTDVLTTITAEKLTGQLLADGDIDTSVTTPGAGGRVKFTWPAGSLDVDAGHYEGEISISYGGGTTVQTVYDRVHFTVREDM